jgi:aryl-alcohol dehydrogenase-like predicted oxidoreductase
VCSPYYALASCWASLRRLQTNYVHLYYQHWPDPQTAIEETLGMMNDLVHQRKGAVRACSNFSAWRVVEPNTSRAAGHLERQQPKRPAGDMERIQLHTASMLASTTGTSPFPKGPG